MLSDIVNIITIVLDLLSVTYIIYQISKFRKENQEEQIRHEVRDYLELAKKVDQLVLILCTNVKEIKMSRLCEGEDK